MQHRNSPLAPTFDGLAMHPLAVLAAALVAAGDHSLLMLGPPGVGKTLLARRISGLRPDLPHEIAGEVQVIHAMSRGDTRQPGEHGNRRPPVRMPHHTVSRDGLCGTASKPVTGYDRDGVAVRSPHWVMRPGECSLAHRGILFLDEYPEHTSANMLAVGEAHREGRVVVHRRGCVLDLPSSFALVAAANLCPCGFLGTTGRDRLPARVCTCPRSALRRYQARMALGRQAFDVVINLGELQDAASPFGVSHGSAAPRPELGSQEHAAIAGRVAWARCELARDTRDPAPVTVADTLAALGVPHPRMLAATLRGDAVLARWRAQAGADVDAAAMTGGAS